MIPVIIMGGIVAGLFTPTEAAAVAVVYALVVPPLFYKELRLRDAGDLRGLGAAQRRDRPDHRAGRAFGWVLTYSKFPFHVAAAIQSVGPSWWLFMILVIALYLFLGTFLTPSEIILVTVPCALPVPRRSASTRSTGWCASSPRRWATSRRRSASACSWGWPSAGCRWRS